ncbi:DUF1700 domain-containing protein [Companilactobacillus zhachilii]|jgi:Predicted membrane protein|uniref:DUF1700 domain-containing protein n=1 Tax=Companilactobacillus zhachilii TaxID=2304606 RepID=UPI0019231D2E|nr:DUF1700 domain-containing protein [Companilactobacillus zhachilii]MBL3530432.1 DUF1700 domain-containing protein [Companilactobacillus zhachilii]
MNKQEFLKDLQKQLKKFGVNNASDYLDYYSEYLDDLIENGATESEAVKKVGGVKKVLIEIISDSDVEIPETSDRLKSALLIVSLPVWGPLLFSLYLIPILLIVAVLLMALGLGIAGVLMLVGSFIVAFKIGILYTIFQFGIALAFIGIATLSEQLFAFMSQKLFNFNKYLFRKFNVRGI